MKQLDTHTVLEILKMIDDKRIDLRAMFEDTRPREFRDGQWVFKNDYVKYGAETALRHLYYEIQSCIEEELNVVENQSPEQ